MTNETLFRVHPSINFARVGTSDEYILSPETSAGLPQQNSQVTGGLPIKPGTESDTVTSSDLRDDDGLLKKQGARFRIYAYNRCDEQQYPSGQGTEVCIGTKLQDGRTVTDMIWSSHLANKKSAAYNVVNNKGIEAYYGGVPQRRNPGVHGDVNNKTRLSQLMIDAGPRAISASKKESAKFNRCTSASIEKQGNIVKLLDYPINFPEDSNDELYEPSGPLDSLGSMHTDEKGRLILLASNGNAVGQYDEYGEVVQMTGDLNNAGWYDSASDGPVNVTLCFDDGSTQDAHGAWVICCDPAYAPQIRNVVSVWDNVYDMFVQNLQLQPDLYNPDNKGYQQCFKPDFGADIKPLFIACNLQRWTANLPPFALGAHTAVDSIKGSDDPDNTIMAGLNFIRNPNNPKESDVGAPLMPLSLGESGTSFLTVTKTQYFKLQQWSKGQYNEGDTQTYGPGELLDIASLSNCLGGRYVPGIEVSYSIMDKEIYIQDWKESGAGPFRIKQKPVNYTNLSKTIPALDIGWIPMHNMTDGLQPGDLSKFMAIPWQTDYNSCSIHATAINTDGVNKSNGALTTLYWSWPSQRPDAVYVAEEVFNNVLPAQKWSIRGPGTYAVNPASAATFQSPIQSIKDWDKIGIIIQATNIDEDDKSFDSNLYLEVQSQLTNPGDATDPVAAWPFNANPAKKKRTCPRH